MLSREIWNSSSGWLLGSEGGGWGFYKAGGSLQVVSPNNIWADNGWHYVSAVYNGVNMYLYADGNFIGSSTVALTSPSISLIMGARHSNDGTSYTDTGFDGNLDDVRIYSRALSATEIQNMYTATK